MHVTVLCDEQLMLRRCIRLYVNLNRGIPTAGPDDQRLVRIVQAILNEPTGLSMVSLANHVRSPAM